MLNVEENRLLTQVSAGTPMGDMLRRYWHPVCAVDQLQQSPFRTKEVKILGEQLVVYRDRSGRLGIVDKYCTHRRASSRTASSKRTASAVSITGGSSTRRAAASSSRSRTRSTQRTASATSARSGVQGRRARWSDLRLHGQLRRRSCRVGATRVGKLCARHRDHAPALQLGPMPGELLRFDPQRASTRLRWNLLSGDPQRAGAELEAHTPPSEDRLRRVQVRHHQAPDHRGSRREPSALADWALHSLPQYPLA